VTGKRDAASGLLLRTLIATRAVMEGDRRHGEAGAGNRGVGGGLSLDDGRQLSSKNATSVGGGAYGDSFLAQGPGYWPPRPGANATVGPKP